MFIGHYALGFAAKRYVPAISLGTLFLASQFADLLWPTLLLLGVEHVAIEPGITVVTPLNFFHYPYSHSLLALAAWGFLFAALYKLLTRARLNAALLLALLVASHWVLDLIVHRPDLPLAPGAAGRYGFGLWNSMAATLLIEFSLFVGGVWLYLRATVARDRTGSMALWALVIFLAAIELANLFGPPPPGVPAIAWAGEAMWLLVLWGYWIDRHRGARSAA